MRRSTLSKFYVTAIALGALSSPVLAGSEPVLSNRVIRTETPAAEITQTAEPGISTEIAGTVAIPSETVTSRRPYHHEGLILSKMQ